MVTPTQSGWLIPVLSSPRALGPVSPELSIPSLPHPYPNHVTTGCVASERLALSGPRRGASPEQSWACSGAPTGFHQGHILQIPKRRRTCRPHLNSPNFRFGGTGSTSLLPSLSPFIHSCIHPPFLQTVGHEQTVGCEITFVNLIVFIQVY